METKETPKLVTAEEKANLKIIAFSAVLFFFALAISLIILPEHCSLFSSNVPGPFMCDSIPPGPGCEPCTDKPTAYAASITAGLGVLLLFLPFLVHMAKRWQNRPSDEVKIFD